jgi:DNA-binding GntR family transcriptional regulator
MQYACLRFWRDITCFFAFSGLDRPKTERNGTIALMRSTEPVRHRGKTRDGIWYTFHAFPRTPFSTHLSLSTKADGAYLALRRAIIEHALRPGTKLPEDKLAEQFGISRTLVRAALARLAADGLIEIGNKRTATVARPSLEEARAVFEVRRCLEAEVVRLVIERWKPAMGTALEAHVREERAAAANYQTTASIRLAGEFHVKLAEMAGNPILRRYLEEVATRCSLILAVHGRPHSSECAINEHRDLIKALCEGDADKAAALMHQHLVDIERRALLPARDGGEDELAMILATYARATR